MNNKNIMDTFNEYFEMVPAVSDEHKNEVYKLRYQVYCVENRFLNPGHYPDDLEIDGYDQHSAHYLIRHRKSGDYAATTRLILPHADNPEKPFPIEIHSRIDHVDLLKTMPRHNLAELSRFCVSKQFRRRKNEQHFVTTVDVDPEADSTQEDKRSSSHLTLALFACAIRISSENDIHYWYAVMEPALKRLVAALGVHFTGIGPLVDYYGMREPCVIKVDDLLDGVAEKDLNYWNMLTDNGALRKQSSRLG